MTRAESLRGSLPSPDSARTVRATEAGRKKDRPGALNIGKPGDRLEREADRAASRVMTGQAAAQVLPAADPPGLQMKPSGTAADAGSAGLALSPGQALDAATRQFFEPRYGHDFGKVRIHADEASSRSALSLGARAYTLGNDVVFARGQYSPHTSAGRHLIAHELAHVVQQGGGNPAAGLAATAPMVQCQWLVPPRQSGGFNRGADRDVEYLRNHDPEEEARRKASIAREKAISDALRPFKEALLGEFEDDPSTTGIVIDTALGMIPIVDQGFDLRDIIAHIFMMSEKGQHKSPARWLGLALTLIGVVPELGSLVKGAAKILIRKGPKAVPELVKALTGVVQVSADLATLAGRFRTLLAKHWSSWVSIGKREFLSALARVEKFLEAAGDAARLGVLRKIREAAGKMLDEAFGKLRKQIDDALDSISPQMLPAGGPPGNFKLPDPTHKSAPMQSTGSGAAPKPKNEYPDFETPKAADAKLVKAQTAALSKHLGLNIPADRVLEAPWVGRVYGSEGQKLSSGTSQGWLRNESKFWTLFKDRFPDDYKLLDADQKVSEAFAKKYGWAKSYVGQKLVHHHLDNGPFVVAIPESLHKRLSGVIHGKAKVVK